MVALIKPQFEAGKEHVGKHGIIRERKVHEEVLTRVLSFMAADGFDVLGLDYSPIKGGKGTSNSWRTLSWLRVPLKLLPRLILTTLLTPRTRS